MSERGGGFFLRLCASEFSEFFEGANKLCDEAIFVIVPGDRFTSCKSPTAVISVCVASNTEPKWLPMISEETISSSV